MASLTTIFDPLNVPLAPPESEIVNVTVTPLMGFDAASFICACSLAGNGCDTVVNWGDPLKTEIVEAAPAVIWKTALLTGAYAEEEARNCLGPV